MSYDSISYHESGYCKLAAELDKVAEISALLKSFCQRKCLDETLWPQIDLAFCECLNNAIEHGCREDASKEVIARWTWRDDQLEIEVEDPGEFHPDAKPNADLPEDPLDESGRGLFIIDSIADSHQREKTSYGQKITMIISTHRPTDILNQMEEMYSLTQTLSSELNAALAEKDIITGFVEDAATCPFIESIVEKGIDRLKGLADITQVDVWTLQEERMLENVYHCGPQPLAIKEAIVPGDQPSPCSTVIATETDQFVDNCSFLSPDDPVYGSGGCAVVSPILYQKDCIGVIAIHGTESEKERLFKTVLPLVRSFTQFIGIAFTSAKAFKQREEFERDRTQLEIASEIQRSLLPSSYPNNNHCKAIGRCDAAMAVGGDYIDAIEIRDVGVLIIIADVMGKGVPAALLATILRTAIRSRLNLAETPGWLLSKINKQFHQELGHLNMFITAQAAFLSYDKKMLKLANAGHCPALLIQPGSNEVTTLSAEGMPLGIDEHDIYEERLIKLEEGARVMFLTDGIYEAENIKGDMIGIDRLAKAAPSFWKDGLEAVPNHAFEFVSKFAAGKNAQDDQTLMALEIL